jgi:formylglycine-generating enzyme required for sulfatase activity
MGCTSDTECDGTNVGGHVVQDEKPPHPVTMTKGFWIGQTEVTQAAYQKITSSNPSKFPGPKRPVEQVAWSAAQAYCKAVGMRLPTEAEWEYAARAGSTVPRYGDIDTIAWDQHNSGGRSHDVGQKTPNAWGLYDTVGNVWEWTSDWWSAQLPAAGTDPIGPSTGADRVTRGGAWNGGSPDIRASVRGRNAPARSYDSVGFRCAGEVP